MFRRLFLRTRGGRIALTLAIGCLLGAILLETVCQGRALLLRRDWAKIMADPGHYYRKSDDPVLGFETKTNFHVSEKDAKTGVERSLWTNSAGFRQQGDDRYESVRRVAVMGDSVTFAIGMDQGSTVPAQLQKQLDPEGARVRVLNCGIPGYGLQEMPHLLDKIHAFYKPDEVIYILNLNDFVERGTRYEGADNGLYRMYNPPTIMTPWFVRKLIYRMKKPEVKTNLTWYRWLYAGTKGVNLPNLLALRDTCKARGQDFSVVIFPSVHAYQKGSPAYALDDLVQQLGSFMTQSGIRWYDPHAIYSDSPDKWIDETDHLVNDEGCAMLAGYLLEKVVSDASKAAAKGDAKP